MTEPENLQAKLYSEFDSDPEPVVNFVCWLVKDYALPEKLQVLDIGCGTGRMLESYDYLGWQVTGLEPDRDFCQQAADLAKSLKHTDVICGGFDDIDMQEQYDLVTAINDPFAYLLDIRQRVKALERMYAALKPGGVLFLEIKNFLYKLLHHEPISEEFEEIDGQRVAHIMENEIDFHNARWITRDEYILEGEKKAVVKAHEVAIISPQELLYFIEKTGFVKVQTYSSYDARASETIIRQADNRF